MSARDDLLAAVSFNDAANAGSTPEELVDACLAEAFTGFADRLTRKAEAMGAVWFRVDQVCDALRRVAADPSTSEVAS